MPNRIIREGILTSDKVDQLDPAAEVFFRRLLSKVDDYGRYDARLSVLRASLYPLRIDRVKEADVTKWLSACQRAGLLILYTHEGKPYLEVCNTGWKARSESKFPKPNTSASNCSQAQASARLDVDVVLDVVEDVVEQVAPPPAPPAPVIPEKQIKGTRIPDDWSLTDEQRAWTRKERPDLDPDKEADRFIDFWRSKPGKDGRKTDWAATWRNWVRGARQGNYSQPAVNPAVPRGIPKVETETPLEREIGWLFQQRNLDAITDEEFKQKAREAQQRYANA